MDEERPIFPHLSRREIDACRTSAWYPAFEDLTIPAQIINLADLGEDKAFRDWLDGDSIFLPEGSQLLADPQPGHPPSPAASAQSQSSDDAAPVYHLPKLNTALRSAIKACRGTAFPKLNWTAPRDAAFILPQTEGGPLHCKSPADVYLLLKSSDLVSHGLDPKRAYASGADDDDSESNLDVAEIPIEIVLKRYHYHIGPSREFRCFVRDDALIGISQRDTNYYNHLQHPETQYNIATYIWRHWNTEIRHTFDGGKSYVFDLHFGENWSGMTIIDFNPYRQSTDSLLFTYSDLRALRNKLDTEEFAPVRTIDSNDLEEHYLPNIRVIDTPSHPDANRTVPVFGDNMMPIDVMELGEGTTMAEFKAAWDEAVARGSRGFIDMGDD